MDDTLGHLGRLLWIVDLNRQSLDRVVPGIKAGRIQRMFEESDWQVLEAKYGRKLEVFSPCPMGIGCVNASIPCPTKSIRRCCACLVTNYADLHPGGWNSGPCPRGPARFGDGRRSAWRHR
ncbi:MAG: hypothetical protein R2873_33115 [Caldilineaceae bacterium]